MLERSSRGRPNRRLTIQTLLRNAQAQLDRAALAAAVGVDDDQLNEWARDTAVLTLPQKIAVVFAVITLATPTSELFRAAATMRGRLAAESEYQLGTTDAKAEGPIRWFGV